MESDIVDRLRTIDMENCMDSDHLFDGLLLEAADEIERLRAELCEARQLIFRLQNFAACCRTSPAATTRDGEEPFISEAL